MSGEKYYNGEIRDSHNRTLGKIYNQDVKDAHNRTLGKVRDFMIKDMDREKDVTIVAAYHFLVKKIF